MGSLKICAKQRNRYVIREKSKEAGSEKMWKFHKFGFITHLENLLKTTKLAVHFVYFIILLEMFLNSSLFTHQKQYLQ